MAEKSLKRSRKTKLVPRCYYNFVPIAPSKSEASTSSAASTVNEAVLPKIKTQIDNEVTYASGTRRAPRVSVEIEVEECENSSAGEQDCSIESRLKPANSFKSPPVPPTDKDKFEIQDISDRYYDSEEPCMPSIRDFIIVLPDRLALLLRQAMLLPSTYAEHKIEIEIRNNWVKFLQLPETDYHESLLQEALTSWRTWSLQGRAIRQTVFTYICLPCNMGWWHLQPFREHIRIHDNFKLFLEQVGHHECNITATIGNSVDRLCRLQVEGECYRCFRTYEKHMKCKKEMYYICEGCQDKLITCFALFRHEGMCFKYQKKVFQKEIPHESHWLCEICNFQCLTKSRYDKHFRFYHTVRSDFIIESHYMKTCPCCSAKYFTGISHVCPNKGFNFKCRFCYRRFQNKFFQYLHECHTKQSSCKICSRDFKMPCMELEHMLKHSRKYMLVYRCTFCTEYVLFLTEQTAVNHLRTHLVKTHRWRTKYEPIIVPRKCLYEELPSGVTLKSMDLFKDVKAKIKLPARNEPLLSLINKPQGRNTRNILKTKSKAKQRRDSNTNVIPHCGEEIISGVVMNASEVLELHKGRSFQEENEEVDVEILDNIDIKEEFNPTCDMNDYGTQDDEIQEEANDIENFLIQNVVKNEVLSDPEDVIFIEESQIEKEEDEIRRYVEENILLKKNNRSGNSSFSQEKTSDALAQNNIQKNNQSIQEPCIKQENIQKVLNEPSLCNVNIKIEKVTNEVEEEDLEKEKLSFGGSTLKLENISLEKSLLELTKQERIIEEILNEENTSQESNQEENSQAISNQGPSTKKNTYQEKISKVSNQELVLQIISEETSNQKQSLQKTTDREEISQEILNQESSLQETTNQIEMSREISNQESSLQEMSNQEEISEETSNQNQSLQVMTNQVMPEETLNQNQSLPEISNQEKSSQKNTNQNLKDENLSNVQIKLEKIYYAEYDSPDHVVVKNEIDLRKILDSSGSSNILTFSKDPNDALDHTRKQSETGATETLTIKEEPLTDEDEDDIIILKDPSDLNSSFESSDTIDIKQEIKEELTETKQEGRTSTDSSRLKRKYKLSERVRTKRTKIKYYSCKKCNYVGTHRNYADHKTVCPFSKTANLDGRFIPAYSPWKRYPCTKCKKEFGSLTKYVHHFPEHELTTTVCPFCEKMPELTLSRHLVVHVRNSFLKLQVIEESAIVRSTRVDQLYKCKICPEKVMFPDFFVHWERHIELKPRKELAAKASAASDDLADKVVVDYVAVLTAEQVQALLDQVVDLTPRKSLSERLCSLCLRNFNRWNDLKRHCIEHLLQDAYALYPKYKFLKCQLCEEGFEKEAQFKRHLRNHGQLPIFNCEICDHSFSDSSNFAKHKKVHGVSSTLICDICKKKFASRAGIINHLERHNNTEPIACQDCDRVFTIPSDYKKHRKSRHFVGDKVYTCRICHKRFGSMRDKWDHLWDVHQERNACTDCPVCDKSYRKLQDVRNHLRDGHTDLPNGLRRKMLYKAQMMAKFAEHVDIALDDDEERLLAMVKQSIVVSDDDNSEKDVPQDESNIAMKQTTVMSDNDKTAHQGQSEAMMMETLVVFHDDDDDDKATEHEGQSNVIMMTQTMVVGGDGDKVSVSRISGTSETVL